MKKPKNDGRPRPKSMEEYKRLMKDWKTQQAGWERRRKAADDEGEEFTEEKPALPVKPIKTSSAGKLSFFPHALFSR